MTNILIPRDKISPEHVMLAALSQILLNEPVTPLFVPEDNNIERYLVDKSCFTIGYDDSPLDKNYSGGAPSYLRLNDIANNNTMVKEYLIMFEHSELWDIIKVLGRGCESHIQLGVQTVKAINFCQEVLIGFNKTIT